MDKQKYEKRMNKKIFRNTIMLYIRQIIIILVNLYTVRVVFNALGAEDYGIYGVVGGVVSLFSFLSGTMASATQRSFSIALGESDELKLKKTFSINIVIYLGIIIIAVLLLETIGVWFINNRLNVPSNREMASEILFQFSIFTFISSILISPYVAIIIAHEDMKLYAYFSIIESGQKLFVAYLINWFKGDSLIFYGFLLLLVGIMNIGIYMIACHRRYEECQFKKIYWDRILFHETLNYTGWELFGQLTTVGRSQAVTILINQTFNPIVVSARSIAVSVSNYINIFSNNFNTGLYPPIIKSYAANDRKRMFALVNIGSKLAFFLVWVFALPLMLRMDFVLTVWLNNPPDSAVLFTRLALIEVLISSVTLPITTAVRAPGKMKEYELSLGSIQILIFFTDVILLSFGNFPAATVFVVAAFGNILMFFTRLILVKKMIDFPVIIYFKEVAVPLLLEIIFSGILIIFVDFLINEGFIGFILFCLISIFTSAAVMFFVGLTKDEKGMVKTLVNKKFMQFLKR